MSGAEPLKTRTLEALLRAEFPPRHYLLAPWLRQGESAMLWAAAGVGKTQVALTMALAVAGGGAFLGWSSAVPRRVLLVDGEMSIEDLQARLAMLAGTIAGFDPVAAGRNLRVVSRQDQGTQAGDFPDLAAEAGQREIVRQAELHGAELILLDNLSTLATLDDENEASAMNPVLNFLLELKARRLACVLVHHSGKSGTTYRGSSKLATTFEVILGLKRKDGAPVGTAAFTTEWTKFRGKATEATTAQEVTLAEVSGKAEWQAVASEDCALEQLVRAINSAEHATQREVAQALGWSEAKASKMVTRAEAEGRLNRGAIKRTFEAVAAARRQPADAAEAAGSTDF